MKTIFSQGKRKLRHAEYAAVRRIYGEYDYQVYTSHNAADSLRMRQEYARHGVIYFINIYPKDPVR